MNESVAFYLKYRPTKLSELIGQTHVKESLSAALAGNRLSHAYLFVGPRGSGKTSTARILAKMVNCTQANPPCNKCDICLSIADGSNLDLIEIDAASNRGIEDIRSLREKIKLAPSTNKKKVYIIDEVHMLTTEAFNALLKTLEEPPSHALFILATTEASKIPQTIVSRCMRLDFSLATPVELKMALDRIIEEEKVDITDGALSLLIKKANGSFRDGIKLLDQLSSHKGKIEDKDILENFKGLDFESLVQFIEVIGKGKVADALVKVAELAKEGIDMKEATLSMVDMLRQIVFIKNGLGEVLTKPNYTIDKYEKLVTLSQNFEIKDLVKILNALQSAYEKLKFASIAELPLELAILEISSAEITGAPVVREEKKADYQDAEIEAVVEVVEEKEDIVIVEPRVEVPVVAVAADTADITKLKEKWTYILETVRSDNFSLEALLRSARISECTQSSVMIEVPYSFHQRILEAPKNRDLLEGVLSEVLGREMRVNCTLGNRPIKKEEVANIEVAQDDEIIRVAAEIFNSDSVN